MNYEITCLCGQKIAVRAENDADAVSQLVIAMDEHVATTAHPDVPKDLTQEQKIGMVTAQMKKV